MKKSRFSKTVSISLAACSVLLLIPSCINDLYDLGNGLNTEMNLGGDSLAIPLGNTDTIRLSDFLDGEDLSMLETMKNGGYGITKKDSINVDITKIDQSSLKIDDQTFTNPNPKTANFGEMSLENFKIPGIAIDTSMSLNLESITLNNFATPVISQQDDFSAVMSDYAVKNRVISDIEVNGGQDKMLSRVSLPSGPGHVELPITDPNPATFSSNNEVSYNIDVPNGVTNIDTIVLKKTPTPAVFEVSIELANAQDVLRGNIIPNISINPSDLFIFSNSALLSSGVIKFTSSDALNPGNSFKKTKTYNIDALNIPGETANGKLSITRVIKSSGSLSVTEAKVWSDKISQVGNINLIVKVSVKNANIESMEFNINPPIETNISGSAPFNIANPIPPEINRVNKVLFYNPAKITFDLQSLHLPEMRNRTITIDQLALTFPREFVFEPISGLSGQTYTINNEVFIPSVGRKIELTLKEMNMSGVPFTGGNLVWNNEISYTGKVSFKGRINSKNIPTAANDPKMAMDIASSMTFKSADVSTNVIPKPLPKTNVPVRLKVDIANQVKSLEVVNLAAGTKMRLNIATPIPPLPLPLWGKNIQIAFPSLFIFSPPLPGNIYVIPDGIFPPPIELTLASLAINKPVVNGKLDISENIQITGGIELRPGNVNSSEIAGLSGKEIKLDASTPDMKITSTSVKLNTLQSEFSDSTNLILEQSNIPAEIVSLDSILFEDNATLQLSVDLTNMPTFNKDLMADLAISFPGLLKFKPGFVDNKNQLIINEKFVDGKLSKTIGLKGMGFDGKTLNGLLAINEKVFYNGIISVEDPTVNSADLNSNPIGINVRVKLSGIKFKYVYGRVNPGIRPETMEVSLTDLPEFMKGDDVVLDVTKPIIVVETQSNVGIPIIASVKLTPMKNGAELTENKQSLSLSIPKVSSVSTQDSNFFWISPDNAGMPQNYTFVESNIQSLFKTIPDYIKFEVDAKADMQEQHFLDINADYKMKVKYDVTVPMAFGKDLKIEMKDTIQDLDESIGKIAFSGKGLEIYGTFLNSIPLELDLQLIPWDKDNKPINVQSGKQIINAGDIHGNATMTELTIKFSDPDGLLKDVRGFEIVFKASSNETVAGTAIKPDNFVKADLKVRLKGGIKIGD